MWWNKKKQRDILLSHELGRLDKGLAPGRKKNKISWNFRCILCLVPSISGSLLFFFWPYLQVLYYSVISDQFHKRPVGLKNYIDTLENPYFRLAFWNSLKLIGFGVPVLMSLSIVIAILLVYHLEKKKVVRDAFIFPMLIPTASIVLVWQELFSFSVSALPVYLLFVWKNIGICVVLLTAALTTIENSIYEAARLDGAAGVMLYRKITIPIIMPALFFTSLLAIVNTFKIFKESYLYYGNKYPPDHSYTLQYFMNNNFLKFDYQALATGSILTSLLVLVIVVAGLQLQRRFQS
ncbi:sugar ABC transporter permease [Anaerocolumna sp. AGMB13020]|uniref:carbohydrate ABC transporter permease n=1 Tax=Anaerocolumna sp. AGMB13020 TaxID=3081750 RepID=UPI0029538791|nr:sugar ABC transporter permease [Anaerocolumna sp. AGMB13020]WOO36613.1 sugar ABC transporter permease [Anaerocolumna sp. AGMB13020]